MLCPWHVQNSLQRHSANFTPNPVFAFFCFLVFEMLIFTSFVGVGLLSKTKNHLHFPAGAQIIKKNACANLLEFWQSRQTSGDVGQTSGKRRARRALDIAEGKRRANVGHIGQAFGCGNLKKRQHLLERR